jgi:hypothetical protein
MGDSIMTDSSMRDLLNHVVEFLQFLDFPHTLEGLNEERADKRKASFNSSISARGATKESRERLRVEMVRRTGCTPISATHRTCTPT